MHVPCKSPLVLGKLSRVTPDPPLTHFGALARSRSVGAAAARGVHFHSTNYVASELEEPLPIDRVHKWTRERERERERERPTGFLPLGLRE